MDIALVAIGLILLLGSAGALIYVCVTYAKDRLTEDFPLRIRIYYWLSVAGVGVGALLFALGMSLLNGYVDSDPGMAALFYVCFGLFALSFAILWSAFGLHYGKTKLQDGPKKLFTWLMFGAIPFSIAFFLLFMQGLGSFLTYPLYNGFGWDNDGTFKMTKAGDSASGFHIAWYGLIILFGALVSYWVADHKFYKEFHKHGILETLILWAFPAGIIGARVWYVVGNWDREFADQPWYSVFEIWNGGLTIIGGAFFGVLVGYIFLRLRRKYVDPRWAVDVCVPAVLLAQAIGRWGNFFNCEVYGRVVNISDGWGWLPNWILGQMNISNSGVALTEGTIHVPLFLIEGMLNIAGYFLIVYGIGKGLKRYTVKGDLAGFYFLWYGVVRFILEPFRDTSFNMGTDDSWSKVNSLIYIIIGVLIIVFLHLHDYCVKEGHKKWVLPAVGLSFVVAALLMPFAKSLTSVYGGEVTSYVGFDLLFSGQAPALLAAYIIVLAGAVLYAAFLVLSVPEDPPGFRDYILIGAIALEVIGALIFLFGKNLTTLERPSGTTFNLSYGFALLGVLSLCSAIIGADRFLARHDARKEKRIEAEEQVFLEDD
jgi:phosphatidylglycerol:prolipoprotein diacylglycerol transferase